MIASGEHPIAAPGNTHRAFVLAASLGLLNVLAFAPLAWAPLSWLSVGGLFVLALRTPNWRRAAQLGGLWGLTFFLGGVSWVFVSLSNFGGMPAALAAVATLLFCAYLALFPAAVAAVFRELARGNAVLAALSFGGLWAGAEWLRGTLLTGFPWLALGYAQLPDAGSPFAWFAPVLGVYGVSAVTATSSALLAIVFLHWQEKRQLLRTPVVLLALLVATAFWCAHTKFTDTINAPLRVALLQGNVAQDEKWSSEQYAATLRNYYELMRDHPATLTVLPETALPTYLNRLPKEYIDALTALARRESAQGAVLAGVIVGDDTRYVNGLVRLGSSPLAGYAKSHLVPFGEMVPPGFDWFMKMMQMPMAGFTSGGVQQPLLHIAHQWIAANICYEDVFGEEIAQAVMTAPRATMLINVSNTAWFGRSWAQPQHLQIARLRAMETGRPMLRATNTGMTAAIGPDGKVLAQLTPFTRGALVVDIDGSEGFTPFLRWGNTLALWLALVLIAPALVLRLKSR